MLKHIIVSASLGALGLAGCQNNDSAQSKPEPQLASPSPAATPLVNPNLTGGTINVDPITNAANRDRVRESADDVRLNPPKEGKLITGFAAHLREAPAGDTISTVETTANVTEVAHDHEGSHYLILYTDPREPAKQLAGWVNKDALENTDWSATAASNAASYKLACPSGQKHVRTTSDFCAATCRTDADCDKKTGMICDGLAFEVAKDGKLSNASYCVATSPRGSARGEMMPPR